MLLASCVLAGLIASQAVYYDDDGDPTGVRTTAARPDHSPRLFQLPLARLQRLGLDTGHYVVCAVAKPALVVRGR